MLTTRDALAKTLTKSQKVTFWSQKNDFGCYFFAHCYGCSKLYFENYFERHINLI